MSLIIDIEPIASTPSNKARIDSIQILPEEKRSIVTTTEGYMNGTEFVPARKGKTFIFKDEGLIRDYSNFITSISLDINAIQQEILSKYTPGDPPLGQPLG